MEDIMKLLTVILGSVLACVLIADGYLYFKKYQPTKTAIKDTAMKNVELERKKMQVMKRKPRRRPNFAGMHEQTQCRFCRSGTKYVDYKDIDTLSRLLTNRGKIYSRKRSGNCAGCQRKVKKAIKRARYMALLPYTS